MRSAALRVEFVVNGVSLIGAVYAAVIAVHHLVTGRSTSIVQWLGSDPFAKTSTSALALAVLLVASAIVGTVICQLMFRLVGRRVHAEEAHRRLRELHAVSDEVAKIEDPLQRRQLLLRIAWGEKQILRLHHERPTKPGRDQQAAIDLLESASWSGAGTDAIREVEYRRSNRQLFLGVIPALAIGMFGAEIVAIDRVGAAGGAVALAGEAVALWLASRGLVAGARYQDRRIARILMDAQWEKAWLGDAPTASDERSDESTERAGRFGLRRPGRIIKPAGPARSRSRAV